jgi:hypothetical protein
MQNTLIVAHALMRAAFTLMGTLAFELGAPLAQLAARIKKLSGIAHSCEGWHCCRK